MNRDTTWPRRLRVLAAAVSAAVGFTSSAFSSVSLEASSSAKITQDADISNNSSPADHKNVLPLPDSGSIYPVNGYSYGNKTLSQNSGNNTATSVAAASVGAVTNSVNLGFTLASGTGLTQNDPSGNVFNGSAELKIEVKGTWDIGSGGYGGNSYGYIAFSLGSTVPAGGSAEVDVNLQWIDPDKMTLPNTYRANYNLSQAIGSGTKITPISNSAKLNSGAVIPSGYRVQVSGTITLLAHDPCGPVTITPSDFEFSATPPIWKFTAPPAGGTADFGNAGNWINVMGAANEPSPIPNQAGARAQFIGSTVAAGPVMVSQAATIGMLDLDQPGVNLQSVNGGALILDTPGSNAVIYARSTNDTTTEGHTIAVPIALIKTTEMINDAAGAVMFTKPIGGPGGIEKSGAGEMVLASPNNTFLGNVDINGGALTVTGAPLATGNVNVNTGGVLSGSGNGTTTGKVGSITLNGGSIHPGSAAADGHVGALTATNLTVTSGDLRMDVGGSVGSDRINVTSVASISGPLTITPVFSSISSIATGSYTLLSAGSLALSPGTTPILTGVPTTSRLNFALDSASVPNTILLNVTGAAPKTINWKGTSSSNWDLNTSLNWQDTTLTNEHYFDYDTVTFDDTALNPNVVLNAVVSPTAITVNNSTIKYSFISSTGTGQITGSTGITKNGIGVLMLGLSNNYSGATQVNQGTLQLASASALSANSTLSLGVDASPAALDLNGFSPTVGGLIMGGTGTNKIITNTGPVAATLNYAGGTSIFGGVFQDGAVGGPTALHVASGMLTLTGNNTNSGATTIDSTASDDPDGVVSDGVATLQIGNGGTTGSLGTGAVVDNGALVLDRSDAIFIGNTISGSGQVIKIGANTAFLAGNNSFTGGLFVRGGGITFASDSSLGAPTSPITLDGGTLTITSPLNSTRPIYLGMAGGVIDTQSANVQLDNISGCGDLTKMGSSTLTTNSVAAEDLVINSGKIAIVPGRDSLHKHSYVESITIGNGATMDLGDNDLIVDYSNNGVPDPAMTTKIMQLISGAYSGGSWNGTGLGSAVARTVAISSSPFKTGLGYAEASAAGQATFDGVPTDGDMILVRYTMLGDANLDGVVNALDFNALATSFGKPNGRWVTGDFNYDGVVGTSDFLQLAQNFGQSIPDAGAALGQLVPEPTAGFAVVGLTLMMIRRRKWPVTGAPGGSST